MNECEKFVVGSRQRDACEGRCYSLEKTNIFRGHEGIGPIDPTVWEARHLGGASTTIQFIPSTPVERRSPSGTGGRSCCGGSVPQPRKSIIGKLATKLGNLVRAGFEVWQDGMKESSSEQQASRGNVCGACPLNENGVCDPNLVKGGCGCVLSWKVRGRALSCPQRRWFDHTDSYQPFSESPIRNLVCHVWPKKGPAWRWNLDQLIQRIELFNGRRIIGIATSSDSESAAAVRDYVAGQGFEFLEFVNDPKTGECVTFMPMLEKVISLNPNEATFRCHAKGVKYGNLFGTESHAVKLWTKAMYETCLDDWPSVQSALESHALAGPFKRYVWMATPFHYSGSFYWMRHSRVFSGNWNSIVKTYAGAEMWPGKVFRSEDAACLFHDNAGNLYDMNEQIGIAKELEIWRLARNLPIY